MTEYPCIRRCGRTTSGALVCDVCLAGDVQKTPVPAHVGSDVHTNGPTLNTSEDDVEQAIISWLSLNGWQVTKTSAKRHAKGVTAGTPDLYARHPQLQRRVWIEVKKPGGVVSEKQMRWREEEIACGGTVIVAYGLGDVVAAINPQGN